MDMKVVVDTLWVLITAMLVFFMDSLFSNLMGEYYKLF